MSVDIRMPNITAPDEAGQLLQIRSYLYQFAEQLQWALNMIESGGTGAVTIQYDVGEVVDRIAESKAQETLNRIKEIIIKSDYLVEKLSGKYVDFDTLYEHMDSKFTKTETVNGEVVKIEFNLAEMDELIRNIYDKVYLGKFTPIPSNADLNEWRTFGCYAITQNTIAETISNLPPYITPRAGIVRVYSPTDSGETGWAYVAQEYIPFDGHGCYRRLLHRDGTDDVWGADEWIAVGGVDSVIESGSITTIDGIVWQYRKWFNGSAECWARRSVDVDATTQWGSALYYGSVSAVELPFAFFAPPVCNISVEKGTAESSNAFFVTSSEQATTVTAPSVLLCRPTPAEGINVNVLYNVHGLWK